MEYEDSRKAAGHEGILDEQTAGQDQDVFYPGQNELASLLINEMKDHAANGIYSYVQVHFSFHSNRIEGNSLDCNQTECLFQFRMNGYDPGPLNHDETEAFNHFSCLEYVIEHLKDPISEEMILNLHYLLKSGIHEHQNHHENAGSYKKASNYIAGHKTASPDRAAAEMKSLISQYQQQQFFALDQLLDFHVQFERIHPFSDGNGRVGRLLLFKECLNHNLMPFIIEDEYKFFYYRGLEQWERENGYLRDTCRLMQDHFCSILRFFEKNLADKH